MEQRWLFAALAMSSAVVLWFPVGGIVSWILGAFFGQAFTASESEFDNLLFPIALLILIGAGLCIAFIGISRKGVMSHGTSRNLLGLSGLVLLVSLWSIAFTTSLREYFVEDYQYCNIMHELGCADWIQGFDIMVIAVTLSALIPIVSIGWVLLRKRVLRNDARRKCTRCGWDNTRTTELCEDCQRRLNSKNAAEKVLLRESPNTTILLVFSNTFSERVEKH